MNLKLNFRFSIPSEWTLCELQQAQKHAWRRQPAPTSAWSEPRCRSCHETRISQKWDIPTRPEISRFWDILLPTEIYQKRDISVRTGISRSKVGYPGSNRDIPQSPISRRHSFLRNTAGGAGSLTSYENAIDRPSITSRMWCCSLARSRRMCMCAAYSLGAAASRAAAVCRTSNPL